MSTVKNILMKTSHKLLLEKLCIILTATGSVESNTDTVDSFSSGQFEDLVFVSFKAISMMIVFGIMSKLLLHFLLWKWLHLCMTNTHVYFSLSSCLNQGHGHLRKRTFTGLYERTTTQKTSFICLFFFLTNCFYFSFYRKNC